MTDQTPTDQTRREIDVAEIRRHFGAIVSAVGQTQGLLLKVISNMQDISEGSSRKSR